MNYSKLALAFLASVSFCQVAVTDTASAAPTKKAIGRLQKAFKKNGLTKTPDLLSAVKPRGGSAGASAVSGDAPPLMSIPESDISELFWRSGVISSIAGSTASPEQCGEFFSSTTDGQSGGFGACFLAESVGRAFEQIGEGGTSLCYMKNFPTAANIEGGGVTVDAGELPGGNITKIFAPPSGNRARLVKVHISGFQGDGPSQEDVNIKVYPTSDKFLYKVDLWFCGEDGIRGRDSIAIKSDGTFSSINENKPSGQQGAYSSRMQAKLTFKDGVPSFDLASPRKVRSEYRDMNGIMKSSLVIKGSTIETKTLDEFGGGRRQSNMITEFSGSSPEDIRFREGAYVVVQDENMGGTFSGATEFRDSFYASAPDSDLMSKLDSASEVEGDEFFDALPEDDYDLSRFDCDAEPDVELSLDMSNPTLLQSVAQCEDRPFRNMRFCFESDAVRAAEMNYFNACIGGDGPA